MPLFEDNRKNSIKSIKPLYSIASFLSLVPSFSTIKKNEMNPYKLRVLFTLIVLLCGALYSSYYLFTDDAQYSKKITVLANITFVFAAFQAMMTICITGFWNCHIYPSFFQGFEEVDKCFGNYQLSSENRIKRINVEMWILHLYTFLLIGFEIFDTQTPTFAITDYFQQMFFQRIEMYVNIIHCHLMYSFGLAIKYRFIKLNMSLSNSITRFKNDVDIPHVALDENSALDKPKYIEDPMQIVKNANIAYNLLTKLVHIYSKLFGWPILLYSVHTGFVLLQLIVKEILTTIEIRSSMRYLLLAVTFSLINIIIATSCHAAKTESKATSTICYNFLLNIPVVNNNIYDRTLRGELLLLARQATFQNPTFSANGFFNVDYTMLFGLIGVIVSYVIVFVQLSTF